MKVLRLVAMEITTTKMATTEEVGRDVEAKEYLKDHRIVELFNNMTAQLIYNRPEDPKKYMIEFLDRLQKSRVTRLDFPCLLDDSNIQSVFGMLDPTNRGFISLKQYQEAMVTLGISDYEQEPEGASDDKINFDVFLTQARHGLTRASATFEGS